MIIENERIRELSEAVDDGQHKIYELEEKLTNLQCEIDDNLEYQLIKFALETKRVILSTCTNGTISLYLLGETEQKVIDSVSVTDSVTYDDLSNKITQKEMWVILNSWKENQ